jgi:voltage-gated potassium channel
MLYPNIYSQVYKKFILSGAVFLTIFTIRTIGYRLTGGEKYSLLDCFYMTVITISTIGYGEIIDLSVSPSGRVFTIFIALSGGRGEPDESAVSVVSGATNGANGTLCE